MLIENIIKDSVKNIEKYDNKSLCHKLSNIAIYYYYAIYMTTDRTEINDNFYYKKAYQLLKEIFSQENVFYFPLGISYGYVYLAFLTRVLDENNEFTEIIKKIEFLMELFSKKKMNKYKSNPNELEASYYDMISGLCSVANYYHYFDKNNKLRKDIIEQFVDIIQKDVKYFSGLYINYKNITNRSFKKYYNEGYVDLSLSHGLGGILNILVDALIDGTKVEGLEKCVRVVYSFYVDNMKCKNNLIILPCIEFWKNGEVVLEYDNRYSWCYGGLGISRILDKVSKYYDDKVHVMIEYSFQNITVNDLNFLNYTSPIFCHGYSGIYHILNLYIFEKNLLINKDVIKYIESKIVDFYKEGQFYIHEFKNKPKEILVENNIIDGIGSILIPLMIKKIGKDNEIFSKMLLIYEESSKI